MIIEVFWMGKTFLYFWYEWRKEIFDAKENEPRVLLEVRIPEEVLEPIKAMETVITGFWQIYGLPNWFEKWWEGQDPTGFTLEIAAVDGVPHFYVRTPKRFETIFRTHIYSQYPQAEITEVEDYTKNVPQDIPNAEWDCWGLEYKNLKPWAYPIKTYRDFEEGTEKEEKRVDPIASLLEGMATLKPGEQLWVQIRCLPCLDEYVPWKDEAKKLRDKLARRKDLTYKPNPIFQDVFGFVMSGKLPEPPKEEKETLPPEMKLTPGEKEVLAAIERKLGKLSFLCNVKYLYLAKRDVLFRPNYRLAMSYFTNFVTENMQGLVPAPDTITKIKQNWYDWFWFTKERVLLRKKRLFKAYVTRTWVGYPNPSVGDPNETGKRRWILSAEEIATLYHFPGKIVAPAPTLPRVETRKAEAPPELPVE